MRIEIPNNLRKARAEIYLGESLIKSYVSIDRKPLPYKSIIIYQLIDKTYLFLERCCNSSGDVTEDLCRHPIQEAIEASPFVVRTNKTGLEYLSRTEEPVDRTLYSIIEDQRKEIQELKSIIKKLDSKSLKFKDDGIYY